MGDKNEAARETRNRGLKDEDHRQHQPDQRTPRRAADQTSPEPERLTTPAEDAGQDISQLENPPQAEGPREKNNNAV